MNNSDLRKRVRETTEVGTVFKNPGRGYSKIKSITEEKIYYMRGKSTICINFSDIEATYELFKGRICTTNDLKEFRPSVFDSKKNGHSCNCTFLFLLLEKAGFINGGISGKGIRGNPFYVEIKEIEDYKMNNAIISN